MAVVPSNGQSDTSVFVGTVFSFNILVSIFRQQISEPVVTDTGLLLCPAPQGYANSESNISDCRVTLNHFLEHHSLLQGISEM